MADQPQQPSKIEVDLQVLRDKNLELLRQITEQWDAIVENFAVAVQEMGQATGAEAPTSGESPTASTPDKAAQVASRGIWQRIRTSVQEAAFDPYTTDRLGRPTRMTEFELASFRTGQIPRGFAGGLQYASYIAAEIAHRINRGSDAMMFLSQIAGYAGRRAMEAAGVWGMAHRLPIIGSLTTDISRGIHRISPLNMAQARAFAQIGLEAGFPQSGAFGTPWWSPAWWHGIRSRWEAWRRSRWGAIPGNIPLIGGLPIPFFEDPFFSYEQAQATEEAIRQFGFAAEPINAYGALTRFRDHGPEAAAEAIIGSLRQDFLRQEIRRLTQEYGGLLTPEMIMRAYDPSLRGRGASLAEVRDSLNGLREAAESAQMGLSTFVQAIFDASDQVSRETGIPTARVRRQLADLAATTGLHPSVIASTMNRNRMLLTMGMTGMDAYSLLKDPYSQGRMFEAGLQIAYGITGGPEVWERARRLEQEGDDRMMRQLVNQLWYVAPTIERMTGMDMQTFLGFMPHARETINISRQIADLSGATTLTEIVQNMREAGVNYRTIERFIDEYRTRDIEESRAEARAIMQGRAEVVRDLSAPERTAFGEPTRNFIVTVDPRYARIFKVIEEYAEGSTGILAESNRKDIFDRVPSRANIRRSR
ncbi:MAG: hypothetical protein QXU32_01705 [Nitrososphaerales archaeon]